MKFYSYSNENKNYTKAITLSNVRTVELIQGSGKSEIRFSVSIVYTDNKHTTLGSLYKEESKKVYREILKLLNE